MAIVNLNKKDFEREIGKFNDKMDDRVSMFGTPVEEVNAKEIQIEVFPNRPDLLSYHGFKRAFLGFLGKKTGLKSYKVRKPERNYKVIVDNSMKNVRPYTVCSIVRGLKLDDHRIKEIIEIQEKLHTTIGRKRKKVAMGIYPLEKIKLPITFTSMEPDKIKFVPLESEKEMSGLEILQNHPTGKEYAHLLSGKQRYPIFIDANKNILSMPPIINSKFTGKVTEKTRDVFIECSGNDLDTLKKSLNIITTALAEMGGKIYQMDVKYKGKTETTPNLDPEEMNLSLENTNKLLGLNLNEKQLKQFIEKMGYEYNKGRTKVPAWRADVLHEVDLIEDVAIAYGFENFIPEIPEISTIGEEDRKEIIKRKISEVLVGLQMLETSSHHLTNKNYQFKKMGTKYENFIEVEDSKTEYNILRHDLTHYLLRILSENSDSEYPQKIFEVGRVFGLEDDKISEWDNLAIALTPGNFTDVKQVFEHLSKILNIKLSVTNLESNPSYFVNGRAAEIHFGSKRIGYIGEVHPRILKNWKIKMPVALFEISLKEAFGEIGN